MKMKPEGGPGGEPRAMFRCARAMRKSCNVMEIVPRSLKGAGIGCQR